MRNSLEEKIIAQILGNVDDEGGVLRRTPLHVAFNADSALVRAAELTPEQIKSRKLFNAIGSRCIGTDYHLPVIDVDGGVKLIQRGKTSKAIVGADYDGSYNSDSALRDVLGDHGIELEVFSFPVLEHSRFVGNTYFKKGMRVSSLVLRASTEIFGAVASTSKNHSHLYINTPFSRDDHGVLIEEFANTGIVSMGWKIMTEQEEMGIVRTPWTEKAQHHHGSD
jgi:hypothetical protein